MYLRGMREIVLFLILFFTLQQARADYVLLPMYAQGQTQHLKAYGVTYWVLDQQYKVQWLLNYRGGSFLLPDTEDIRRECKIRGVTFELLNEAQASQILSYIESP